MISTMGNSMDFAAISNRLKNVGRKETEIEIEGQEEIIDTYGNYTENDKKRKRNMGN